jgi:hypothetical protein
VSRHPSYSQLRTLSEEGLTAELDRIAERTELSAQCYLQELARRELARQSTTLLWLTWTVALLIFVVTVLGVALVLNV